ncbi:MAG: histidine kinase, partial [Desulfuromonas sp.]
ASHELRSPLNAIIGFSSILLRSISGSLNEKQEAQTSSILRSGKYLLTLINNIMDVSQVETGRMACSNEEFLVGDVINEVLDISREPISQKNLDLTVDVPDIVMFSDRQRLIQCLHNLVNNAIKYTEEGAIAIRARTFDEGDGKSLVEIVVEDTGIGIAEEDIPDIFTPFSRIDSHLKGDVEGAGLGLFLVHKLVTEMLGGRIDVESKPEEGSRFSLLLPRWNSDDCSTPADLQSEVPN